MNRNVALVVGGAGFIGSHLIRTLCEDPLTTVTCVDIRKPERMISGVDYVIADVRSNSWFNEVPKPDVIYNLAAVHTTPGHPTHEYYETNIAGATQVTAFARKYDVRTIVFTSSISVYGPGEETKTEESAPKPASAYGWSKWLAEGIHRAWLEEDVDRRLVICRPAVIFGHGEGGNFTRMAKLLKKGIFIYPGRRDTIKACFYVEDLVEALQYALSLDERYILFNGAYPDRYTIEEIVRTFKRSAFPTAKELMIPRWIVMALASALQPLSALRLGIHPDRVLKLVRSTDVVPGWLESRAMAKHEQLGFAFERWKTQSDAQFD